MKSLAYYNCAVNISIVAVLLTGCGEPQVPIGAPVAMDQMMARKPIGYKQDLLYVSAGAENVFVYSYPNGKHLGSLGYFESPGPECSDRSGNVFVSTAQRFAKAPSSTCFITAQSTGGSFRGNT